MQNLTVTLQGLMPTNIKCCYYFWNAGAVPAVEVPRGSGVSIADISCTLELSAGLCAVCLVCGRVCGWVCWGSALHRRVGWALASRVFGVGVESGWEYYWLATMWQVVKGVLERKTVSIGDPHG